MLNIIANLKSGKGRGLKNVRKVAEYLIAKGVPYALHLTNKPGHATDLAAALTENGGQIAVLGGDGTFHEVLNGIADIENTTLGFIPSGRGNDFVRAAGCSLDPIKAVNDILAGRTRNIDYIDVGGRRCLNVAGTGLDIDVLERVAGRTDKISYLLSLIHCLRNFSPYHVAVTVGGEKYEYDCAMVGVCNGIAIGGNIRIAPIAKIDDGKLDVVAVTLPKNGKIMSILPKFVKGKHMDMDITHHFVCDEVLIESEKPVQLDGEIYRDLTLDCKIVKGGLKTYIVN